MADFKLSHTAEEVDELLNKAKNAVLHTPQELTEEQKAQARENIGAASMTSEGSADALIVVDDGGRLRVKSNDSERIEAEYLGLCSSAKLSDGKISITPSAESSTASRIYYMFPIAKGYKITVSVGNTWTKDDYWYELVECSSDLTILKAPGFSEGSSITAATITVSEKDAAYGYLGIRWKNASGVQPPNKWEVSDSDYENAFRVSIVGEDPSRYAGCFILVDEDGVVRAQSNERPVLDIESPWQNVAHRGLMTNVRENTIPAFYEALLDGCKMCECDVRMTSDGILVLCHDAAITGTVDGANTTMTVSESTYSQLSTLELTSSETYGSVRMPTLEDVFRFARYYGMRFLLDVKDTSDNCTDAIINLVARYKMNEKVMYFTGTNPTVVLKKFIDADTYAKGVFYYSSGISNLNAVSSDPSRIIVAITPSELSLEAINAIRNIGYGVYCWSVSASNASTAFQYLPDFVEYVNETDVSTVMESHLNSVSFW